MCRGFSLNIHRPGCGFEFSNVLGCFPSVLRILQNLECFFRRLLTLKNEEEIRRAVGILGSLEDFVFVTTKCLDPGTYVVSVTGWSSSQAANIRYQLGISIGQSPEGPPPLTIGAAPAIRLRLTPIGPAGDGSIIAVGNQASGSGIIRAGSAVPGANSGSNSQISASVPGDVLLALAVGPISGTDEKFGPDPAQANDVYERILARAPVLMPSEIFVELPILVHLPDSSAKQDRSLSPVIDVIRSLNRLDWRQAVDLLHRLEMDRFENLETSEPEQRGEGSDPEAAKDGATELSSLGHGVPSGARGLAAAAAMVLLGSDPFHQRSCKDSRSKSKGLERRELTAND